MSMAMMAADVSDGCVLWGRGRGVFGGGGAGSLKDYYAANMAMAADVSGFCGFGGEGVRGACVAEQGVCSVCPGTLQQHPTCSCGGLWR